uniref:Uncharacterized protein n=1 Tax=Rangifer tarandus platyrhynchus TaxID=3082113 RepID=A0ACB0FB10_RANTA|nr:unnamed protein product [Rangifer tarandus platyrhynchus]
MGRLLSGPSQSPCPANRRQCVRALSNAARSSPSRPRLLLAGEEGKDIENPKDFSEEKEYYEPGMKAVQWPNLRNADTRYMF